MVLEPNQVHSGPRDPGPRAVSLLPAATEIVFALGLGERLLAVSHDCDHPAEVSRLPQLTRCEIHEAGLSSAQVDAWVRETLARYGTLYTIDERLLRKLSPEVILTQQLCDVCAPAYGSVEALAQTLPRPPQLVNLEPSSLEEIFDNVREVAAALGDPQAGQQLVDSLEARVETVRRTAEQAQTSPRCVLIEWLDPIYCSGHWGPGLVQIAGGHEPLGHPGGDSVRVDWEQVVESQPEVLVIAGCGNRVEQTVRELPRLQERPGWAELPAVLNRQVFVVDGSAYFSRPGPRIVDSLELLAGMLHPDLFPDFGPERQSRERLKRVATLGRRDA